MEKKKNDKKNTGVVAGNTPAPDTKTAKNQNKAEEVPAGTGETNTTGGDSNEKQSGENTPVDTQPKTAGTGGQGDNTQGGKVKETPADKKRAEIAQNIFARTAHTVLFFTSDFIPFALENDAISHARAPHLTDKTIIKLLKQ